jgi:phage tail sheath protein FI
MAAPNVSLTEVDLSTRVPQFPGLYGGIVIPSKKGPTDRAYLVGSDTEFLRVFTPDERVEVGDDLSLFSALIFLAKSNKLWVRRATDGNLLYGGYDVAALGTTNAKWASGEADPINHVFTDTTLFAIAGANGGLWNDKVEVMIYNYVQSPTKVKEPNAFLIEVYKRGSNTLLESFVCSKVKGQRDGFGRNIYVEDALKGSNYISGWDNPAAAASFTEVTAESLGTGDGSTKVFGSTLANPNSGSPCVPGSVVITVDTMTVTDDGQGNLIGDVDANGSNVINYVTGVTTVTFVTAPLTSSDVSCAYQSATNVFPTEQKTKTTLFGGADCAVGHPSGDELVAFLDDFANQNKVPLTLIMDGGTATVAFQKQIITICEKRMDCFGILSTPYSAEDNSDYLNSIVDYRKLSLNANTSYAAIYSPHLEYYDQFNDRNIFVAPDGFAGAQISETAATREIWYPVGGNTRGMLNSALDCKRRFSDAECDYLYDNGINPIKFTPGKGIRIWGQKTLLNRPSDLQSINVRMMLLVVEPSIKEALENFLFELNDDATRSVVVAILKSALDNIKARRGLDDFKVICDSSNNTANDVANNRMVVWVLLKAKKAVEFIPTTIGIVGQDISFSLATGQL